MGVERQIPEEVQRAINWLHERSIMPPHKCLTSCHSSTIERFIADLAAEVETLKGLLNEYRTQHYRKWVISPLEACKCELCKRTDQQLQPTGVKD